MKFRSVSLYRFVEPFTLSAEHLNDYLKNHPLLTCPKSEAFSQGWVSPFGQDNELFVHVCNGNILLIAGKEEKILPSSVIKEAISDKIKFIEQRENRTIYRKEKIQIREQVIFELRKQAFTRKKLLRAYIDTKNNWLIVDSPNRNRAEEFCAMLRKSLGGLKLMLPNTQKNPSKTMTNWLLSSHNLQSFKIENDCEMFDEQQRSAFIKCKYQDLTAEEIINHLRSGKIITTLSMSWNEKIAFDLCEDLTLKKIRFLNLLEQSKKNSKEESLAEQLDADFALMSGEFSDLLNDLINLFEGLETVETTSTTERIN